MNLFEKKRIITSLFLLHVVAAVLLVLILQEAFILSARLRYELLLQDHNSSLSNYFIVNANDINPEQLASPADIQGINAAAEPGRDTVSQATITLSATQLRSEPNLLADLPEIRSALNSGSGFAERHHNDSDIREYASALLVETADRQLIVYSVIHDGDIHRRLLAIAFSIILSLSLLFVVLSVLLLQNNRSFAQSIGQLEEGLREYSKGNFAYRISPPKQSSLLRITRKLHLMADEQQLKITELMRQRQELESILENTQEAIILLNSSERIQVINRRAAEMFGCEMELSRLSGSSIANALRSSELNQAVEQLIQHGQLKGKKILFFNSQLEKYLSLEIDGFSIDEEQMPEARLLLIIRDISELQRLEQIRREFVSNVSHELKTPITSIQGFSETLLEGALQDSSSAEKFVAIIHRQSLRMEQIVADLLSLSRLEQQGLAIQFQDTDLVKLCDYVQDLCRDKADARKINIHSSFEGDSNASLNSNLFEQALFNLTDNAIKYGREGGNVWIAMKRTEGELQVTVRDDGPGIAKRFLDRLFERFFRVDTGRSASMGGTGLGLAIVKHICNAHGGQIQTESTVGEGTVFTMTYPQPPLQPEQNG